MHVRDEKLMLVCGHGLHFKNALLGPELHPHTFSGGICSGGGLSIRERILQLCRVWHYPSPQRQVSQHYRDLRNASIERSVLNFLNSSSAVISSLFSPCPCALKRWDAHYLLSILHHEGSQGMRYVPEEVGVKLERVEKRCTIVCVFSLLLSLPFCINIYFFFFFFFFLSLSPSLSLFLPLSFLTHFFSLFSILYFVSLSILRFTRLTPRSK